ncbi:MAG: helix-turn-helix transcriptional regulator [Terricaulis sp.]
MANDEYELALVQEKAVAHVQAMALRLLDRGGMTRTELADAMGVSQSYVSQIFADEPQNFSIKNAARIFHYLGEKLVFTCDGIERMNREAISRNAQRAAALHASAKTFSWIGHDISNDDSGSCQARDLVAA